MPTYSYHCDACDRDFEREQRITEAPIRKCPACGKLRARRMISGGNFILKGGGWYSDGYGLKSDRPAPSESSESSESSKKSSDKKSSDKSSDGGSKSSSGKPDGG